MHRMSAIAGPKWATMSDAQRHAYNHRAKVEKAAARGTSSPALMPPMGNGVPRFERMDCTGRKLSVGWSTALEMRRDKYSFCTLY